MLFMALLMDTYHVSYMGEDLLNNPLFNKGTGFTLEEREEFGLLGLLPNHVSTIEEQMIRRLKDFRRQEGDIAKYIFLSAMHNRNETLFFRFALDNITETLPLIYTPTVGDISIHFSTYYTHHRGIYLSYPMMDKIDHIIQACPRKEVDVIVVTDGERILGLGDLGMGGMAIPVGKLSLYTLFGGIHPSRTLPILLDVGTNNEKLLKDPLYLGWRHERVRDKEYDAFIDKFVQSIRKRYPKVLLQWEDFAKPNARPLLDRYRDQILSFNDDIQGTASVTLAALLAAVKTANSTLAQQRFAILGGGSAGIGICEEIARAMIAEGTNKQEALERFYVVDIKGLVHTNLKGIDESQKKFAQEYEKISKWHVTDPQKISLLDVMKNAHPTVLIGVSTQGGAFTEEIVKEMAKHTMRPVIFPLSNPTSKSEATPRDLLNWTKGKAIIATGSPFDPVIYEGKQFNISQCNNVYIFPGVGLGAIASHARKVTDEMFLTAAQSLSKHSPMLKDPHDFLFPSFEKLRAVTRQIAIDVAFQAQKEGVAPSATPQDTIAQIDRAIWYPQYVRYKKK